MKKTSNKDADKITREYFSTSNTLLRNYVSGSDEHFSTTNYAGSQRGESEMTSEDRDNFMKNKQNQNKQSNVHIKLLAAQQSGSIQAFAAQRQTVRRHKKRIQRIEKEQIKVQEDVEELSSDVDVLQRQSAKSKKNWTNTKIRLKT